MLILPFNIPYIACFSRKAIICSAVKGNKENMPFCLVTACKEIGAFISNNNFPNALRKPLMRSRHTDSSVNQGSGSENSNDATAAPWFGGIE